LKKYENIVSRLEHVTQTQLQRELHHNGQAKSAGGKGRADLMSRVADGRINGALPQCPTCKIGKLRSSQYQPATGGSSKTIYCPGGYSEERRRKVDCPFETDSIRRATWSSAV
jgi:hypothetical protein